MTQSRMSDQRLLREEAYADERHLDVRRRTHELYTLEPVDFVQWTLERLDWRGDERVLDVGCGPGDLLGRLIAHPRGSPLGDRAPVARVDQNQGRGRPPEGAFTASGGPSGLVGLDLSPGMVAAAVASHARLAGWVLAGDAQALPFPSGAFDVVVAGHMLYHVPDIARAVVEAARVLAPGGHFLATTNSEHTMPQYFALRDRAAACCPGMAEPEPTTHRFSLENGTGILQASFGRVEVHTLPGTLRFPAAQPLVDYFASARALHMRSGHTDAEWQAVLDVVRAEVQAVIEREGHFDVTKVSGALVAHKVGS